MNSSPSTETSSASSRASRSRSPRPRPREVGSGPGRGRFSPVPGRATSIPIDFLGGVVNVVSIVVIAWLALDGRDIGQSTASIAQLLIGAAAFGLALSFALLWLILEGVDYRGRGPRVASEVMLIVMPTLVTASLVLTLIRT
jgi:small-conductance mechanosensitive channel